MNKRKIKVSLMELKISISILPSNLKIKTKGEQYLMMKSIMKSKLKSLFKNMVNIKKTLSLIIMMKMIDIQHCYYFIWLEHAETTKLCVV